MPAASTGYEIVHQTVQAIADPHSNEVQLNAPTGTFIVNAFHERESGALVCPAAYGAPVAGGLFTYVHDGQGRITGAIFLPEDANGSNENYEAYIVCAGA